MSSVIKFENVCFGYSQNKSLLHQIHFEVLKNEFVAITGPNGSGKSTMIKLLLQEKKAISGNIFLNVDFQNVAYIPQNVGLLFQNFPASVKEVLLLTTKYKEKYPHIIHQLGIENIQNQLVSTLSGGQMQKVAIAKALMNNAKLLILDEPTTGIDEESVQELYHLLDSMDTTIVMITHDLAGCIAYVDRVYCIENGHMCALSKDVIEEELSHRHQHR